MENNNQNPQLQIVKSMIGLDSTSESRLVIEPNPEQNHLQQHQNQHPRLSATDCSLLESQNVRCLPEPPRPAAITASSSPPLTRCLEYTGGNCCLSEDTNRLLPGRESARLMALENGENRSAQPTGLLEHQQNNHQLHHLVLVVHPAGGDERPEQREARDADDLTAPLLPRQETEGPDNTLTRDNGCLVSVYRRAIRPHQCIWIYVAGFFTGCIIRWTLMTNNNGTGHHVPSVDRYRLIWNCAHTLSSPSGDGGENPLSNGTSVQSQAVQFYQTLTNLAAPTECSWNTDFGQVYALYIIHQTLSIPDEWFLSPALDPSSFQISQLCHWSRLRCNDEDRVKDLILNHANLTGTLPRELGGLVHLQRLQLYSNEGVFGFLPSELGLLGQLQDLEVHDTKLGGTIPNEFGQLSQLEILSLKGTLLTGSIPSGVCKLPQLTRIEADKHKVQCDCDSCAQTIL